MVKEESEKSSTSGMTHHAVGISTDSNDLFWDSYPTDMLTPAQRKHLRNVMRKKVRSK